MKYLKRTSDNEAYNNVRAKLPYPYVCHAVGEKDTHFAISSPCDSVYYKIEDDVLYIRRSNEEGYKERKLYTNTDSARNGWYSSAGNTGVTKVVIEQPILPVSCARFFDNMKAITVIENMHYLRLKFCKSCFAMFNNCVELEDIGDISHWKMGNVLTMQNMFYNCNKINNIGTLEDWDVSNVKNMSFVFAHCNALTNTLNLSKWNVSNVTNMQAMFVGTNHLVEIGNLYNWDTSNVTNTASMFANCERLSYAVIKSLEGWDLSNATTISEMFNGCCRYTESPMAFGEEDVLDLRKWNISKISSLYALFHVGPKFRSYDISTWDLSRVTQYGLSFAYLSGKTIEGKYYGCRSLRFGKNLREDLSNDWNINGRMFYQSNVWEHFYLDGTPFDVSKQITSWSSINAQFQLEGRWYKKDGTPIGGGKMAEPMAMMAMSLEDEAEEPKALFTENDYSEV